LDWLERTEWGKRIKVRHGLYTWAGRVALDEMIAEMVKNTSARVMQSCGYPKII
jgi:hypothetical protein